MHGCTSKGGKVGSGGKVVKLIVIISYGKGAIMCHQYDKLDGAYFAKFVQDNFVNKFRLANKNGSRLFVQDNRCEPMLTVVFSLCWVFFF